MDNILTLVYNGIRSIYLSFVGAVDFLFQPLPGTEILGGVSIITLFAFGGLTAYLIYAIVRWITV